MASEFFILLNIVAIAFCLLSGIVLFSFNTVNRSPRRLLALYFFVLAYGLILIECFFTGMILKWPHLFRTALISGYVFPPLAYLYVRQNIKPGIHLKDALLFLPALFYIIDFLPFFSLPAAEKIPIIQYELDHPEWIMSHGEGWMTPLWFHQVFRNLINIFYGILSVSLLFRVNRVKQPAFFSENASTLKWLYFFVIMQFVSFLPLLILVAMGYSHLSFYATTIPNVIMGVVTSLMLFFQPSVFYGFGGFLYESEDPIRVSASEREFEYKQLPNLFLELTSKEEKYINAYVELDPGITEPADPHSKISPLERPKLYVVSRQWEYMTKEEAGMLKDRVMVFIRDNKPFLRTGYSINEFAKDLGIPLKKFSAYLNHSEGMNYRDLINRSRIEYCMKQLEGGAWQNLTLEAISVECGFNNRNSFTAAFKKISGTTPSDFIHQLKQNKPGNSPVQDFFAN